MPSTITPGGYIKLLTAAMLSMFAGSSAVHLYYKPLNDFQEIVDKRKEEIRKEREAEKLAQASQQQQ